FWILNAAEERWSNCYVALVAATLFTGHTTNTEVLNIIHIRSEMLATMGVVGSFLVYLRVPASRTWRLYLIPMVLGALAKSPATMFAPLFLVYVMLFEEQLTLADLFDRRSWPRIRGAIAKSIPAFVIGGIAYLFVSSMDAPTVKAAYPGIRGFRLDYLQTQ